MRRVSRIALLALSWLVACAAEVSAPTTVPEPVASRSSALVSAPAAMVKRIASYVQGPESSDTLALDEAAVAFDGRVYLNGRFNGPTRLWASDGTAAGTVVLSTSYGFLLRQPVFDAGLLVVDSPLLVVLPPGGGAPRTLATGLSSVGDAAPFGHLIGFTAGYALWSSDGTAAGTRALGSFSELPSGLALLGGTNHLYFGARDGTHGRELWVTDGTVAGTHLVKDLAAGTADSSFGIASVLGDALVFQTAGQALWITDGTDAGTRQLPGTPAQMFETAVTWNGRVWMSLGDGTSASGVWSTDGTKLEQTIPVTSSEHVEQYLPAGNRLFFLRRNYSTGTNTLWVTDGTASGTVSLGKTSSRSVRMERFGNEVVFVGTSASTGDELYITDGTVAGTRLWVDVTPGAAGSNPSSLRAAGGRMFFAADTARGRLWLSTDGSFAGTSVLENPTLATSGALSQLAAIGNGRIGFQALLPETGFEPWVSDGTAAGTALLADIVPGRPDSWPTNFELLPGTSTLSFCTQEASFSSYTRWYDGSSTLRRFSDCWHDYRALQGTTYAVDRTTQLFPGYSYTQDQSIVSVDPLTGASSVRFSAYGGLGFLTTLMPFRGSLFFGGWTSGTGNEPYLLGADGTASLVAEVYPGTSSGAPREFKVLGSRLFFRDTANRLWATDGTASGTTLLQSTASEAFVLGGRMWFAANSGFELWSTDGTVAGTRREVSWTPFTWFPVGTVNGRLLLRNAAFADIVASDGTATGTVSLGLNGGGVTRMQALEPEGFALFPSRDSRGSELWITDGSVAGTRVVQDIAPGAASSNPDSVTRAGDRVFFTADDGNGRELWSMAVKDLLPPMSVTCPMPVYTEATSPSGATVSLEDAGVLATSRAGNATTITFSRPSGTFPVGETAVTATATDTDGNSATCRLTVVVRDTTAPTVTCPADVKVTTNTYAWHAVSFDPPVATDAISTPTVSLTKASGSTFQIGTTTVTATATDLAGNAATCTFRVNVTYVNPLSIACPPDTTIDSPAASGTTVEVPAATASDLLSTATIAYSPASGPFVVGTTRVTATATDKLGNTATCGYFVTVRYVDPLSIACPPEMVAEATSPLGAYVLPTATAVDSAGPATLSYVPAAGVFPLGETPVTATATDAFGNSESCSLVVKVRDTTPPVLGCPASVVVEAEDATGATASFQLTAVDLASSAALSSSHGSGSRFPLGTTMVTATATDAVGNESSCAFDVVVRDTRPPELTCPEDLLLEASSAAGAVAHYTATATDAVSAPTVSFDTPSGSTFAFGTTSVLAIARDEAGNTGTCTFRVTVRDRTGPALGCPADLVAEAASAEGARVAFEISAADAVSSAHVQSSAASGDLFPLGRTVVEVTATDDAGNVSQCRFGIDVRDTTAPSISCPADLHLEAAGTDGTTAEFAATAIDTVSTPKLTFSRASGTRFPLGRTTVTAEAADAAGNKANCHFDVVVGDGTAPEITCPAPVLAEATGPDGALVSYPLPTATDDVSEPNVAAEPANGTRFALGTTVVHARAVDAVGNASACDFTVTVRDTTPPEIACPETVVVEAEGPLGAPATFVPTARDAVSSVSLHTSIASGSTFAVGENIVEADARDLAGNVARCRFVVAVRDTTPPTVTCPNDADLQAAGPGGTRLYFAARAHDTVSVPRLVSMPGSGSEFPPGETRVTVSATDDAGNAATCSFRVTVRDATAPRITCPGTIDAEATSAAGARVHFPPALASDDAGEPTVSYSHPSGNPFALGTTTITARATDEAGNEASCTFDVRVRDTTAPLATCPPDVIAEATGPRGAEVSFATAAVTDAVDAAPAQVAEPASGSTFPLGRTIVRIQATDASHNTGACAFAVEVRDTHAPTLVCPEVLEAVADADGAAAVSFAPVQATDTVDVAPRISRTPATTRFPTGDTRVEVHAADRSGNEAVCALIVRVAPAPAQAAAPDGCASAGADAAALAGLAALVRGLRRRSLR